MSPISLPWPRLLHPPATPLSPASRPAAEPGETAVARHQNFLWLKAHLTGLEAGLEMEPEVVLSYWFHLRYLWLWAGATPLSQAPSLQPPLPAFLSAPGIDVSLEPEPLTPAARRRVIQAARHFFVWAKIARPAQFQAVPLAWIETLQPAGRLHPASRPGPRQSETGLK